MTNEERERMEQRLNEAMRRLGGIPMFNPMPPPRLAPIETPHDFNVRILVGHPTAMGEFMLSIKAETHLKAKQQAIIQLSNILANVKRDEFKLAVICVEAESKE